MKDLEFSDVLKELRNKTGLNIQRFSKAIGSNEHTYRGWETGKHQPSILTKATMLKRAQNFVRSITVEIDDNTEYLSYDDVKSLLTEVDAAAKEERERVPYNTVVNALNQHCPPSVSIKILDSIRGDMGW